MNESDDFGSGSWSSGTWSFSFSKIVLVVSRAQNPLVVSVSQNLLVVSAAQNPLVVSVDYFHLVKSLEYSDMVESMFFLFLSSHWYILIRSGHLNILIWSSYLNIFIYWSPRIIFPLKNIHNFKLIIFNKVTVLFCHDHYILYNFCNRMRRCELVGATRQPTRSGSGGEDGLDFIRCVSPKSTNFWVLLKTEVLAKFILSHRLTSTTSAETIYALITPLK